MENCGLQDYFQASNHNLSKASCNYIIQQWGWGRLTGLMARPEALDEENPISKTFRLHIRMFLHEYCWYVISI